jgi:hypothetical protein
MERKLEEKTLENTTSSQIGILRTTMLSPNWITKSSERRLLKSIGKTINTMPSLVNITTQKKSKSSRSEQIQFID